MRAAHEKNDDTELWSHGYSEYSIAVEFMQAVEYVTAVEYVAAVEYFVESKDDVPTEPWSLGVLPQLIRVPLPPWTNKLYPTSGLHLRRKNFQKQQPAIFTIIDSKKNNANQNLLVTNMRHFVCLTHGMIPGSQQSVW